jgi:enamine deaminase RidA (YjgF/YER057c/UK114 family)
VTVEQAQECARIAALNGLAAIRQVLGNLDRIKQVVKVTGFVRSGEGFREHPRVLNGASDLLKEIFGEAGMHSRSAVGSRELPLGAPVEVEMIVEVIL